MKTTTVETGPFPRELIIKAATVEARNWVIIAGNVFSVDPGWLSQKTSAALPFCCVLVVDERYNFARVKEYFESFS